MTKNKGQASLEFLMTYGWAIIIIAVALLVLYQWGVFNPQGKMEPTYLGFWGVVPMDFVYRSNGDVEFTLQNNIIDGNLNITCINITYLDTLYTTGPLGTASIPLSAGNTSNRKIAKDLTHFSAVTHGTSFNVFMAIDYIDNRLNSSYVFKSSGTIQGNVENTVT